jgi:predicted acetyltransferase
MKGFLWFKVLLGALLLSGLYEIFQGLVGGPLGIYARESRLASLLGLNDLSSESTQAFWRFISWSKNQWQAVAWTGLVHIAISIALMSLLGTIPRRTE